MQAILGRLPLGNRYKMVEEREKDLWKQIDEIDENIARFSAKEVLIEEN